MTTRLMIIAFCGSSCSDEIKKVGRRVTPTNIYSFSTLTSWLFTLISYRYYCVPRYDQTKTQNYQRDHMA